MSEHLHRIGQALRRTIIHSPTSFTCYGVASRALSSPVRRAMSCATARAFLLSQLQAQLYDSAYIRGGSAAAIWASPASDAASFLDNLSQANAGTGCIQRNWQVIKSDATEIVVGRGMGLRLVVRPEDCATEAGAIQSPGSSVGLRIRKELLNASPGYYMALSNRDHHPGGNQLRVRVYWNLKPDGAAQLVRLCTRALNENNLFFHLKVLKEPGAYSRCDAGVLYFQKADYAAVMRALGPAIQLLVPYLKPEVPLFTKLLLPGVGLAEDPGGSESFGQHRCRLFAEAMIRAYEQRARRFDDRLALLVDYFASEKINLSAPYLNPESNDEYSGMEISAA